MDHFELVSEYKPAGDQPEAIQKLAQGIKLGLEGEVEKHSEVLGRSAQWTKTMRVSSVPKYLCVEVGGGSGREA